MSILTHRERKTEPSAAFARMDQLFDEWRRSLPWRAPLTGAFGWPADELIRVDELRDGDTVVVRAELPGIDPDKDVELTVADGLLRIKAERRVEETTEDKDYTRRELRYGAMSRTLPLPEGATQSDIKASYTNGVLEIRVPTAEPPTKEEPTKIAITSG